MHSYSGNRELFCDYLKRKSRKLTPSWIINMVSDRAVGHVILLHLMKSINYSTRFVWISMLTEYGTFYSCIVEDSQPNAKKSQKLGVVEILVLKLRTEHLPPWQLRPLEPFLILAHKLVSPQFNFQCTVPVHLLIVSHNMWLLCKWSQWANRICHDIEYRSVPNSLWWVLERCWNIISKKNSRWRWKFSFFQWSPISLLRIHRKVFFYTGGIEVLRQLISKSTSFVQDIC